MINDSFYLNLALDAAWPFSFLTYPNPAVGAILLDKHGAILSIGAHKVKGSPHAELDAILQALHIENPGQELSSSELYELAITRKNALKDASIYVTLEPCSHSGLTPSCSHLIQALGIKKVIYAASDKARGGEQFLREKGLECSLCPDKAIQKRANTLLEPFLAWQDNRAFRFFKLALNRSANPLGSVTCSASRTMVHELRARCDLLVTGGKTLREDRPILDARLAGKGFWSEHELVAKELLHSKPPNLCVKSRNPSALRDIPALFVPNREVFYEEPKGALNIMYEGGAGLLEALKDDIDWLLIFTSNKLGQNPSQQGSDLASDLASSLASEFLWTLNLELEPLFEGKIGDESFGYFRLKR